MNIKRTLIAAMTFIGGTYFVLDFIVPPTVPVASTKGVYVSGTPATLTVQTAEGATFRSQVTGDLTISVNRRDAKGKIMPAPVRLRDVGPGRWVILRTGSFEIAEVLQAGPDGQPVLKTKDGRTVTLRPGEKLFTQEATPAEVQPAAGLAVNVEVQNAKVTAVEYGTATLLVKGQKREFPLNGNTLMLRNIRYEPPAEVTTLDAKVGDTITVGPKTFFADNRDTAARFNEVLGTMALGLGLLSLAMVNGRSLLKRGGKDRYQSALFFLAVVVGVITGQFRYMDPGTDQRGFSDFIVLQVQVAIGATIFSLLAFYLASAAYRAFRLRNTEAGLMMISAVIVMIGQTPLAQMLSGWLGKDLEYLWLPNIAGWILRQPNSAIVRALIFGVMLGAIGTALRYWLNLERSAAMRSDD
jgi:hypothetical protein